MNLRNMFVILQREYYQRVKKRTFLLTTLLTPILIIGLVSAPAIIAATSDGSDSSPMYKVAVVDDSGFVAEALETNKRVEYTTISSSDVERVKGSREVSAILYINSDIVDSKSVSMDMFKEGTLKEKQQIEGDLEKIISDKKVEGYNIDNLKQIIADLKINVSINSQLIKDDGNIEQSSSELNTISGFVGAFFIYMFVLSYSSMIMSSVIDEKSSKVVEVMVSTVSPVHMMLGKIFGVGLVAITQFVIWGVFVLIGGTIAISLFTEQLAFNPDMVAMATSGVDMGASLPSTSEIILSKITDFGFIFKALSVFTIFFIGGYLFYASCFAAIGSAVDNLQDVQQLQMPVTIPIIMSIVLLPMVMDDPNGTLAVVLSFIPFTSPVIMLGRMGGDVPLWEIISSIVVLYASICVMIWVAGRIYRVGIFMHGKKPKLTDLVKWIRYK